MFHRGFVPPSAGELFVRFIAPYDDGMDPAMTAGSAGG